MHIPVLIAGFVNSSFSDQTLNSTPGISKSTVFQMTSVFFSGLFIMKVNSLDVPHIRVFVAQTIALNRSSPSVQGSSPTPNFRFAPESGKCVGQSPTKYFLAKASHRSGKNSRKSFTKNFKNNSGKEKNIFHKEPAKKFSGQSVKIFTAPVPTKIPDREQHRSNQKGRHFPPHPS